jgi:hypothetical protein
VFDTLDLNGDGVIDEMELNDLVLSMYQVRAFVQFSFPPFSPLSLSLDVSMPSDLGRLLLA